MSEPPADRVPHELASLRQRLQQLQAALADRDRIDAALQRVRDGIRQMREAADWQRTVEILECELAGVVDCYSCGLNLLDLEADVQIDYFTTDHGLERHEVPGVPAVLRQAVDTGVPVYRRTRAEIDALVERMRPEVKCVIDVPFSEGTLAMNHQREDAFDARDIDVLVRFARVVDEGLSRLRDLRDLRAEVDLRRRNERRLEEAHRRLQETQAQLLEAESLRVLVETAGGAAHEINQPLQVLTLAMDQLVRSGTVDDEQAQVLQAEIERIDGIVRRMAKVRAYRTRTYPGGGRIVSFDDSAADGD